MTKTVPFRQPTNAAKPPQTSEAWVQPGASTPALLPAANGTPAIVMSRMTFDVPKSLHMRFKMQCLRRDKHEYEIGSLIMERAVAELEKE